MADLIARATLFLGSMRQYNKLKKHHKDAQYIKVEKILKLMTLRDIETQQLIAENNEQLVRLEEKITALQLQLRTAHELIETHLSNIPTLEAISGVVQTALTTHATKETVLALADPPPEQPSKPASYR